MKAITVAPGKPDQVQVSELPDPRPESGTLLVQGRLLGICGTDVDIVENGYGWPPPGADRLLIGHESLGTVLDAPGGSGFETGDLVVGIVRRPDPVPCEPCGQGEWDFCRHGRYTERGIKELDGYGAQQWRIEPDYAIRLDPELGDCGVLLEPASVLAKAWEQTDWIFTRASWRPRVALITGAGPIGLFAALLEHRTVRLGQRRPPPLPAGRRRPGQGRPRLAASPDHPTGADGRLRCRAAQKHRRREGRRRPHRVSTAVTIRYRLES